MPHSGRSLDATGRKETDPRLAQVVEMRSFAGLTEEEIGLLLDISPRTVKRDWAIAKRWLKAELGPAAKRLRARRLSRQMLFNILNNPLEVGVARWIPGRLRYTDSGWIKCTTSRIIRAFVR